MNKSDQEIRMQQKHIFKCFELPFRLIARDGRNGTVAGH